MDLAVEDLVALRVLVALGDRGDGFRGLDQLGAIIRPLVARRLHRLLDDVERLPAAKHVRVGRDVVGVGDAGAILVHAHLAAIEGVELRGLGAGIARIGLPEIGTLEELEAWALEAHGFQAVDEAEQRRVATAVEFAEFLHEGQHGGAHHHVVDHFGVSRNLREVAREGGFRRRNGDQRIDVAALRLDRGGEIVAVVIAEGEVREDHGDLLAEVLGNPRRHGDHLAAHVRDARLEGVAVELAGGHVMALGDHVIGQLQFARARGRAHDDMAEQRAEGHVALVLGGEFLDHLGAAAGIGRVVLGDDLDRAAGDAAGFVDQLHRSVRRLPVPLAIGGTDAGLVNLEANADRLGGLRLRIAHEARSGEHGCCPRTRQFQGGAARDALLFRHDQLRGRHDFLHLCLPRMPGPGLTPGRIISKEMTADRGVRLHPHASGGSGSGTTAAAPAIDCDPTV